MEEATHWNGSSVAWMAELHNMAARLESMKLYMKFRGEKLT